MEKMIEVISKIETKIMRLPQLIFQINFAKTSSRMRYVPIAIGRSDLLIHCSPREIASLHSQ